MAERNYANIFHNALQPVSVWMGTEQSFAGAENVLFEAAISYLARWTLNKERRGFFDLVFVHALAQPILGVSETMTGGKKSSIKTTYSDAFMNGFRQVPAVFVSEYCVQTFKGGFHVPSVKMNDVLFTAGSKIISRPIMRVIYENGPAAHQNMPLKNDEVVDAQRVAYKKNWKIDE